MGVEKHFFAFAVSNRYSCRRPRSMVSAKTLFRRRPAESAMAFQRCQHVLLLTGLRPTRRRRRNRCVLLLLLCCSCCCSWPLVSECGEVFSGATKTSFVATKASAVPVASRAVAASRAAFAAVSADAYWFFDDVLSFRRPECFFFCIIVVAGFWIRRTAILFVLSPLALASRDEPLLRSKKRSSFSFSILFSPTTQTTLFSFTKPWQLKSCHSL